ncbi:unnamed protein product [Darwinula stevensoni]|uniref:Uncharacterized protein n=1 Tax=Darwinula stevensoni TaxID=69355 RepID=A0A7R8XCE2_9CRUS|nr:unnamed protein product [Darwinula stevensoni]CAG0893695.1 unnamed protein product [Darwinula stevensoni]
MNTSSTQETPSPTKLITTCEEVGLFQDLPTSNPFDEVFRRAAEGKYQPTLVISSSPLNTPQVLPQQLEIPQISSGSNSPQGDDTISNLPVIKPKGEELTPAADNTRDEPSINRLVACQHPISTESSILLVFHGAVFLRYLICYGILIYFPSAQLTSNLHILTKGDAT